MACYIPYYVTLPHFHVPLPNKTAEREPNSHLTLPKKKMRTPTAHIATAPNKEQTLSFLRLALATPTSRAVRTFPVTLLRLPFSVRHSVMACYIPKYVTLPHFHVTLPNKTAEPEPNSHLTLPKNNKNPNRTYSYCPQQRTNLVLLTARPCYSYQQGCRNFSIHSSSLSLFRAPLSDGVLYPILCHSATSSCHSAK
jgi:hypothetical protein